MRLTLLVLTFCLSASSLRAQSFPADSLAPDAFRIYTADGTPMTLADVAAAMDTVDVVFLGEQHDDAIAHVVQHDLLARAAARYTAERPVALSLEMFARDVQPVLDEYLTGLITEDHVRSSRLWPNYETAYRPLVEFSKAHDLPVLAANVPRRYVNRVARLGPSSLADLPATARAWLPPLPYPGPSDAYRAKWNALMQEMAASHHTTADSSDSSNASVDSVEAADTTEAAPPAHGAGFMLDAQVLWDAGMAHTIAQYLTDHPGTLVLHMVGAFHVEGGLGLPEQLQHYRPGTRALVVVLQPAPEGAAFNEAEHAGLGDVVVLTSVE